MRFAAVLFVLLLGLPAVGFAVTPEDLARLRAAGLGDQVLLALVDTTGVQGRVGADDAMDLARLFLPFDRLGAETTGTPGAGLGLALTKGLVESMGGAIGVDTTMGVGSTFWFELPAATADTRMREPSIDSQADPHAARGDATVVVIDDNEANLDLLRRVLAMRPGVRATFARDGAEGLALVTADPPDLVLLDMNLPLIGGGEVLRRIRANPATATLAPI